MNFYARATRLALVGWALYLVIALSAFALHSHASHEPSGVSCAICLAQNVTGAAAVVASLVLAAPVLRWRDASWLLASTALASTPIARRDEARAPPTQVFFPAS